MAYTSQHAQALSSTASPERLRQLHDRNILVFNQLEEAIPDVQEFEEPYGSIGCEGKSPREAR